MCVLIMFKNQNQHTGVGGGTGPVAGRVTSLPVGSRSEVGAWFDFG